jgi:hypothetical protein
MGNRNFAHTAVIKNKGDKEGGLCTNGILTVDLR